jgi:hypothetical protein
MLCAAPDVLKAVESSLIPAYSRLFPRKIFSSKPERARESGEKVLFLGTREGSRDGLP